MPLHPLSTVPLPMGYLAARNSGVSAFRVWPGSPGRLTRAGSSAGFLGIPTLSPWSARERFPEFLPKRVFNFLPSANKGLGFLSIPVPNPNSLVRPFFPPNWAALPLVPKGPQLGLASQQGGGLPKFPTKSRNGLSGTNYILSKTQSIPNRPPSANDYPLALHSLIRDG